MNFLSVHVTSLVTSVSFNEIVHASNSLQQLHSFALMKWLLRQFPHVHLLGRSGVKYVNFELCGLMNLLCDINLKLIITSQINPWIPLSYHSKICRDFLLFSVYGNLPSLLGFLQWKLKLQLSS